MLTYMTFAETQFVMLQALDEWKGYFKSFPNFLFFSLHKW